VRSFAVAVLTVAGLGVPAAAFMAGGGQTEPGPGVRPAIDMFMTQHEFSTGDVPLTASASPSPSSTPRHHAGRHHRAVLQPAGAR